MCDIRDFYEGDIIELTMKDGSILSGVVILLTWPDDTEDGRADISIENEKGIFIAYIDEVKSFKKFT